MPRIHVDRAFSTLAAGVTAADVALTLPSGHGARFGAYGAADWSIVTLEDAADPSIFERVRVTARTGDSLTVQRGAEGTTARAWTTGALVEMRATASSFAAATSSNPGLVAIDGTPLDAANPIVLARTVARRGARHKALEWSTPIGAGADTNAFAVGTLWLTRHEVMQGGSGYDRIAALNLTLTGSVTGFEMGVYHEGADGKPAARLAMNTGTPLGSTYQELTLAGCVPTGDFVWLAVLWLGGTSVTSRRLLGPVGDMPPQDASVAAILGSTNFAGYSVAGQSALPSTLVGATLTVVNGTPRLGLRKAA